MPDSLRYGSAPSRRTRLLELVREQGFCTTTELVRALGVSDMTVRRDAQRLADEGAVRIVHGGVSVLPPAALAGSGDYDERTARMAAAKRAIGRYAARLVAPGETIALDSGTTTLEMARHLPPDQTCTVVTHSVPVINQLLGRQRIQVVGIGGVLHHDTQSFAGPSTLAVLAGLHVDTVFLAASGIGTRGVFGATDFDAVTKRALIEIADRVVLVTDSSKFSSTAMVRICGLDAVDRIIVDNGLDTEHRALLAGHQVGVTEITVDAPAGGTVRHPVGVTTA